MTSLSKFVVSNTGRAVAVSTGDVESSICIPLYWRHGAINRSGEGKWWIASMNFVSLKQEKITEATMK